MRPKDLVNSLLEDVDSRIQEIIDAIKLEVENGSSGRWPLPFASYVNERVGDMDLECSQ